MTTRIRESDGSEADYERIVAVIRSVDPTEFANAVELVERDRVLAAGGLRRGWELAERGADVVGLGRWAQMMSVDDPEMFLARVEVVPSAQGHGTGRALLSQLESRVRMADGKSLLSSVVEVDVRAIDFAERAGFREIERSWRSSLDLTMFDASRWGPSVATFRESFEVETLQVLRATRDDWFPRLYDLYMETDLDAPSTLPLKAMDPDLFRARHIDSAETMLGGIFIALDGDAWVGLTELRSVADDPTALRQELTGVRRAFRGRGIATALKAIALEHAKGQGYRFVRTWNAKSNAAMLAINEAVGFEREQGEIELLKRL